MADLLTPGIHPRESEFVYDPDIRQWLNGTCGVTSCAMVEWAETGREIHTLDVYRIMRAHNLCGVNGETASTDWLAYAHLRGLPVAEFHSYSVPWPDAQAFIQRHAGGSAVIVETTNGQALVDMVSGKGENARNLQRHIIALWGTGVYRGVAGVWASDGDNFAVGNVLQFYSWQTIAAAALCAGLAITISGGQQHMAWTKNADGTATDDKQHHVGAGFANEIFSQNWQGSDGLTGEEYYAQNQSFCALSNGSVLSWDGQSVHANEAAQTLVAIWTAEQSATTQVADLTNQLSGVHAQIAQLQQQLAACQAQQQPPSDPAAEAWLALGKSLKAALTALP